jgi:hypothetical protein
MNYLELTDEEKRAFIQSLDESDMDWLEFLTREVGHLSAALSRLYRLKLDTAPTRKEGEKE